MKHTRFFTFLLLLTAVTAACGKTPQDGPDSQFPVLSVATLNVDGLPERVLFVKVNPDGPGSRYTPVIGAQLLQGDYDFIAVQENFNYADALFTMMDGAYYHDTWRGGIPGAGVDDKTTAFNTDGLNGFWKKGALLITGETITPWSVSYGRVDHANDALINKGFRRYEMLMAESRQEVVIYNLHMDASDEADEATGEDVPDQAARMQQWTELRDDILLRLDNRPVIVLGDLNTFYEHDDVKTLFFDAIEKSGQATAHDVYIELECGGEFPALEKGPVSYPQRDGWLAKGETLDKILYINPVGGSQLQPVSFRVIRETFTREDGITPLGDHYPVQAQFRIVP